MMKICYFLRIRRSSKPKSNTHFETELIVVRALHFTLSIGLISSQIQLKLDENLLADERRQTVMMKVCYFWSPGRG